MPLCLSNPFKRAETDRPQNRMYALMALVGGAGFSQLCARNLNVFSNTFIVPLVHVRGLVQSPCGKINVIMTLGGEGVLVHDV